MWQLWFNLDSRIFIQFIFKVFIQFLFNPLFFIQPCWGEVVNFIYWGESYVNHPRDGMMTGKGVIKQVKLVV